MMFCLMIWSNWCLNSVCRNCVDEGDGAEKQSLFVAKWFDHKVLAVYLLRKLRNMNAAEKDEMTVFCRFLPWLYFLSGFPKLLCLHLKSCALMWEVAI